MQLYWPQIHSELLHHCNRITQPVRGADCWSGCCLAASGQDRNQRRSRQGSRVDLKLLVETSENQITSGLRWARPCIPPLLKVVPQTSHPVKGQERETAAGL